MTKQNIIRKLTSRKLWMSIALFVSGCMTYASAANKAEAMAGLIMQFAAVVAYIVGEGLVDAANKPTYGADEHVETPPDNTVEE